MKMRIWAILPFLRLVYGACRYEGVTPAPIIGIATPTPLTYTNTVSVSGCETDPLSYSDFLTAFVDGTGYPALNPVLVTFSNAGIVYDVFTFPGLIVTILTPGEYVTMALSDSYETVTWSVPVASPQAVLSPTGSGPTFIVSSISSPTLSVTAATKSTTLEQFSPTTFTALAPTASAAPAANPGSTGSTTSTSSSVPIAGIVGGVIGAVVVIAAMAIFAWYKINTSRQNAAVATSLADERGIYPPPGPGANQDYVEKSNPHAQEQSHEILGPPGLRYPTNMEPVSANVSGDY